MLNLLSLSTLGVSSRLEAQSLAPDYTSCSLTFSSAEYLPPLTTLF